MPDSGFWPHVMGKVGVRFRYANPLEDTKICDAQVFLTKNLYCRFSSLHLQNLIEIKAHIFLKWVQYGKSIIF